MYKIRLADIVIAQLFGEILHKVLIADKNNLNIFVFNSSSDIYFRELLRKSCYIFFYNVVYTS